MSGVCRLTAVGQIWPAAWFCKQGFIGAQPHPSIYVLSEGCCSATVAESSGCNSDNMALKASNMYCLTLDRSLSEPMYVSKEKIWLKACASLQHVRDGTLHQPG